MKDKTYIPQRRSFFKRVAMLGGAFALLPSTGGTAVDPLPSDTRSGVRQKKGYRLTPHIQKYYATLDSPVATTAVKTKE